MKFRYTITGVYEVSEETAKANYNTTDPDAMIAIDSEADPYEWMEMAEGLPHDQLPELTIELVPEGDGSGNEHHS